MLTGVYFKPLGILIEDIFIYTRTYLTEFFILVFVCIYVCDDGLVEIETRRGNVSDKWLFIYCAVCWIKSCIINPLRGICIT